MSNTTELKPCPCGAQSHISEIIGGWMVNCRSPRCGFETVRSAREDAVSVWNTRPVEDALRARIAELEAALTAIDRSAPGRASIRDRLRARMDATPDFEDLDKLERQREQGWNAAFGKLQKARKTV